MNKGAIMLPCHDYQGGGFDLAVRGLAGRDVLMSYMNKAGHVKLSLSLRAVGIEIHAGTSRYSMPEGRSYGINAHDLSGVEQAKSYSA